MERKFLDKCDSSIQRKFLDFSLLGNECSTEQVSRERKFSMWTFRSQERKCRGTKSLEAGRGIIQMCRCSNVLNAFLKREFENWR